MKKMLFALLAGLNVFVYLQSVGLLNHAAASSGDEENPALERLQLLSEVRNPALTGNATFAKQPAPAVIAGADIPHWGDHGKSRMATSSNCYRIGSFNDAEAARMAQEQIAGQIPAAAVMAKPEESVEGYWLLYPKARDLDAARHHRAMLQQKGIKDVWLIDKGEMQGAISLGLFSTREEAESHRIKMLAQNIQSQIQVRMVRNERYWVQFQWLESRQKLDEALVELRIEHPQLPLDNFESCQ